MKVLVAFGSGYMADLLLLRCSPTVVRKLLTGIGKTAQTLVTIYLIRKNDCFTSSIY